MPSRSGRACPRASAPKPGPPAGSVGVSATSAASGAATAGQTAFDTDRHRLVAPQDKGEARPDAETPFGRAPRARGIALIRAPSPGPRGAGGTPSALPRTAGTGR